MLKRLLLTVLLAAGMASQASAATYYLDSRNGSDSFNGEEAHPWKTITRANSGTLSPAVASGDVVIVLPGNYTGSINPACQATATDWVTFIGSLTEPGNRIFSGGAVSKPYLSIKGVTFSGGLTLTSNRDSVQYCTVSGNLTTGASDYCFLGSNHFNGYSFTMDGGPRSSVYSRGSTYSDNHFTNLFGSPSSGTSNSFFFSGVDSTNILFNTFDINAADPTVKPSAFFFVFRSSYMSFRGNRFNFNSYFPEGARDFSIFRVVRDSVTYLSFDCDTVIQNGTARAQFRFSSSGNYPQYKTTNHISYDSCFIYLRNSNEGIWSQEQMNQATITRSVVINEAGPALTATDGTVGRNFFDHNTFVGKVSSSAPSIFSISGSGWGDTTVVTNNIFYSLNTVLPNFPAAAVSYSATEYDSTFSATGTTHANHLISDHNLYAYYGSSAWDPIYNVAAPDTIGKRSIGVYTGWDTLGWGQQFAWPGTHATEREKSVYSDSVTLSAGTFEDTVSVVAGVFTDSVTITLPAYLPLADSTFKVAVARTTVTPPSSGKLPVTRTVKVAPTSGIVALTPMLTPGDLLPNTFWKSRWCPGCDDSSRYGSPLFMDSTSSPPNVNLTRYSLARYAGVDSADIGALAYTSPPVLFMDPTALTFTNGGNAFIDSVYVTFRNAGDGDSLRITSMAISDLATGVGTSTISATTATLGPGIGTEIKVVFYPGSGRAWIGGRWQYVELDGEAFFTGTTNDPTNPTFSIPITITSAEE